MKTVLPAFYSSEAFEILQSMMIQKYAKIDGELCSNELLLAQMSKKIKAEIEIEPSERSILCDALIDILLGNENLGLGKLDSYKKVSEQIADSYIITLGFLSQYQAMRNVIKETFQLFQSPSFLRTAYNNSMILGDLVQSRNILDKLKKITPSKQIDEFKDKLTDIENALISQIPLEKYKQLHIITLGMAEEQRIFVSSVHHAKQDDFSLIFSLIAEPEKIANMNMALSYKLAEQGLLDSDLVIGFELGKIKED